MAATSRAKALLAARRLPIRTNSADYSIDADTIGTDWRNATSSDWSRAASSFPIWSFFGEIPAGSLTEAVVAARRCCARAEAREAGDSCHASST
jgi:hypothetical protein